MKKKSEIEFNKKSLLVIIVLDVLIIGFFLAEVNAADPVSPDSISISSNTTRAAPSAKMVNISGGYIANMNLSATVQNTRWKAFVGHVIGRFTLQDENGAQIFDWSLTSNTGRVYATRNSSSPTWTNVECANLTTLNAENTLLEHSNVNDNLTATFNISAGASHNPFYVGGVYINSNTCPTLNTYKNNATQDSDFEEMALYDNTNVFFSTILEDDETGYNSLDYDFQMIIPENGNSSRSVITAYYLYVEVGT
jgi:hypothetical protein